MDAVQNQIFQASWPRGHEPVFPPNTDVVATVALAVFAGYFSIWLGIGTAIAAAAFWGIRKVATWVIHQSSGPFADQRQVNEAPANREKLRAQYEAVEMKTPDGLKLDGILHEGQHKKAVIYCHGSGQFYETSANWVIEFITGYVGDVSVLCFNPRGVLESEGISSPEMLPYDSFTAFEYLVSRGYHPQDISFIGYSLGGAIATLGASFAQAKYVHVPLGAVNVNSFADLASETRHIFGDGVIGRIASIFILTYGWKLDVASAWQTLKHPEKAIVCHIQDKVIPFEASLYQATPHSENNILKGEVDGHRHENFHIPDLYDAIWSIRGLLDMDPSRHQRASPIQDVVA